MDIDADTLFSSMANNTRLRSLILLLGHDELCVCELTHALGLAQPHISRHLALLRESGLVSDRREGLWVNYRINPEVPAWVLNVLWEVYEGISGQPPYKDDEVVLEKMPNRPGVSQCA